MIHKYKLILWNFFCFTAIGLSFSIILSLIPLIKKISSDIKAQGEIPIIEKNSQRKIWKRGKDNSSIIINENTSSSIINGKKFHKAEGWTSIVWRKLNDS